MIPDELLTEEQRAQKFERQEKEQEMATTAMFVVGAMLLGGTIGMTIVGPMLEKLGLLVR